MENANTHFKDVARALNQFENSREAALANEDSARSLAESVKSALRTLETCVHGLEDVLGAIE